jgi:hypothetical protein
LFLIAAPASLTAQDQTRSEVWPEIDVYYRLSATHRLFFLLSPSVSREQNYGEVMLAGHFEMGLFPIFRGQWAGTYDVDRFRFLRLKLGAGYSTSLPSSDQSSKEWRGIVEVTGRVSLPLEILGALRTRADLRWLDDGYSTRYRARLTLERETEITRGFSMIPYASVEPFYDTRFATWNKVQYQFGITVPVVSMLVVEAYYNRQEDWRSQPALVNALGLVAIVYF